MFKVLKTLDYRDLSGEGMSVRLDCVANDLVYGQSNIRNLHVGFRLGDSPCGSYETAEIIRNEESGLNPRLNQPQHELDERIALRRSGIHSVGWQVSQNFANDSQRRWNGRTPIPGLYCFSCSLLFSRFNTLFTLRCDLSIFADALTVKSTHLRLR